MNGFKLYQNCDVKFWFQNLGTSWLGKLCGSKSDIELVFNGLYNLKATSGELDYSFDGSATFWTSKKQMSQYFYNRAYLSIDCEDSSILDSLAREQSVQKMKEIMEDQIILFTPARTDGREYNLNLKQIE